MRKRADCEECSTARCVTPQNRRGGSEEACEPAGTWKFAQMGKKRGKKHKLWCLVRLLPSSLPYFISISTPDVPLYYTCSFPYPVFRLNDYVLIKKKAGLVSVVNFPRHELTY